MIDNQADTLIQKRVALAAGDATAEVTTLLNDSLIWDLTHDRVDAVLEAVDLSIWDAIEQSIEH